MDINLDVVRYLLEGGLSRLGKSVAALFPPDPDLLFDRKTENGNLSSIHCKPEIFEKF